MEKRALIAALLSALVLLLWYAVFPPAKPKPVEVPGVGTPAAVATPGVTPTVPAEAPAAAKEPAPAAVRGAEGGERILSGEGWRAVVDLDGGVLRSLVLTGYKDPEGKPLELVAAGDERPLAMAATGPWNSEPYAASQDGADVVLRWSDGKGAWVEKRIGPAKGRYGLAVNVRGGGAAAQGGAIVGVGRVVTAAEASRFGSVGAVVRLGGKLDRISPEKLAAPRDLRGSVEFAGVEDHYFLMVFLPDTPVQSVAVSAEKVGESHVAVVAAVGRGGELNGTLYAGPKDHQILVGYGRGLDETLSFGMFGFFSVAFLAVLRWIHGWVANWGVAIIVLTAAIRLLLFPLTHKSTVAMRRMQAVQPKMKAIQDRYQERAKKDPQVRQRMNQEIMQLYKQEGVNPMGGCLPTLVQLPILFALYTLFANAIELRQAPFFLWVTDLSVPETLFSVGSFPIRPLALLMGGSMFLQQKMAPAVGDPAQRRMFMMMPIIFTFMFYGFPSGLVLYWLVNNLLTIGQQLVTERLLRRGAAAR